MLTAIDLFCGAGGMTLGLSRAGFEVIGAMDYWEPAVRTYRKNFHHPTVLGDIRNLSVEDFREVIDRHSAEVDLITGGPPCQGFSIQRIGKDKDERNNLIFEFARFVESFRPRMFLMENVTGLLGARGRDFASQFTDILTECGYAVKSQVVNAAEYGVPQTRKRVFFYGWLEGSMPPFAFPPPDHAPDDFLTVKEAIGDLPPPPADHSAPVNDPLHRRMKMAAINAERLRHIPPGGGMEHLPVELRVNAHKNGADKIGHRYVYGRLAPDEPASTITARFDSFTRGKFAHPYEDRNITLREGARLQTFPDDFRFEGSQEEIAALIGNAVPPLLAQKIGSAVARHLRGEPEDNGWSGRLFSSPYSSGNANSLSENNMSSKRRTPKRRESVRVWKTSLHQSFRLFPEPSPGLKIFLESEGMTEQEIRRRLPYDRSRAKGPARELPDRKRYRDPRQVFRAVGLLYEQEVEGDGGERRLRVTDLGKAVSRWLDTISPKNFDVLGKHLASALAVCQLRNPTDEGRVYDASVEVFPCAFIWRAMLALDGKINSDELTRAIFKVTNEDELNEAVERIAEARRKNDPDLMGEPVGRDSDRIIPWVAMASFGWTLFPDKRGRDGDGYWEIPNKTKDILRAASGVKHKHREFDATDPRAVEKYVEHISRAASVPEDVR